MQVYISRATTVQSFLRWNLHLFFFFDFAHGDIDRCHRATCMGLESDSAGRTQFLVEPTISTMREGTPPHSKQKPSASSNSVAYPLRFQAQEHVAFRGRELGSRRLSVAGATTSTTKTPLSNESEVMRVKNLVRPPPPPCSRSILNRRRRRKLKTPLPDPRESSIVLPP
ncbi:Polyadenylate-binding protein (PABP) [Psidium guajava]|nr:Polyadenylate-binding protein (PABP) [Psidium guajava]